MALFATRVNNGKCEMEDEKADDVKLGALDKTKSGRHQIGLPAPKALPQA